MDNNLFSFIIFCMMSIIISTMSHYKINNTLYASILSAIVASLTFQIIGYFVVGYLDPFFILVEATGSDLHI